MTHAPTLTFGRYQGAAVTAVPDGYLSWLAGQARNVPPDLRLAAQRELAARRRASAPPPPWPSARAAASAEALANHLRQLDYLDRRGGAAGAAVTADDVLELLRDLAAAGVRLRAASGHVYVLAAAGALTPDLWGRLASSLGTLRAVSHAAVVDAERVAGVTLDLADPAAPLARPRPPVPADCLVWLANHCHRRAAALDRRAAALADRLDRLAAHDAERDPVRRALGVAEHLRRRWSRRVAALDGVRRRRWVGVRAGLEDLRGYCESQAARARRRGRGLASGSGDGRAGADDPPAWGDLVSALLELLNAAPAAAIGA